jgi:hypothetical protein
MEPAAYQGRMENLPPQVPVEEMHPQQQGQGHSSAEQQIPSAANWTVYNMDVTRGSLDHEHDPNDPRTHVGWTASPTLKLAKDMPWMTSNWQQPSIRSNVEKDDET